MSARGAPRAAWTWIGCSIVRVAHFLDPFVAEGFFTAMRVTTTSGNLGFVLCRRKRWQLVKKCHEVPDMGVLHAFAPRGHAGRLDAVLDHPEGLRSGKIKRPRKIGRRRIQAPTEFARLRARRQVAACAHGIVVAGAAAQTLKTLQIRGYLD